MKFTKEWMMIKCERCGSDFNYLYLTKEGDRVYEEQIISKQ